MSDDVLMVAMRLVGCLPNQSGKRGVMGISLDEAQKVASVAVELSRSKGVRTAIAVVDNAVSLIALARLDDARSYYPDSARGKAMAKALREGNPANNSPVRLAPTPSNRRRATCTEAASCLLPERYQSCEATR